MLWFFAIYSVIGWIIEVAYHAVTMGKVVNRGFLKKREDKFYEKRKKTVGAVYGAPSFL